MNYKSLILVLLIFSISSCGHKNPKNRGWENYGGSKAMISGGGKINTSSSDVYLAFSL